MSLPLLLNLRIVSGEEGKTALEKKIAALVREYSAQLGIRQQVRVTIVDSNSRLASVESVARERDTYRIEFEGAFLRTLDDRDLNAAVAHELGHVWIFTHFPYLQTEALANKQALKLVPRTDLERIYKKVWRRKGANGDLGRIMEPAEETDASSQSK